MTKQIPNSSWIVDRTFFKAKVVDDFRREYIKWGDDEGHGFDIEDESFKEVDEFIHSVIKLSYSGCLELYQWPSDDVDDECDYFERFDDNYTIPRHLFEVV